MFAEVVLDLPLEKKFDYSVPPQLVSRVSPGIRAWVPFGKRRLPGYIVCLKDTSEYQGSKPIIKLIDKESLLLPPLIELAEWIAHYYHCELAKIFKTMLPPRIRQISPKKDEVKYVRLISPGEDLIVLEKKAPRQAQILRVLAKQSRAIKLMDLVRLTRGTPAAIDSLYKKGLVDIFTERINRDPYQREVFQSTLPFRLNEEQQTAYNFIRGMRAGAVLLQGVTGSGKTEIYLQVIASMLQQKKGAIVAVPEISLTPQTVQRFKERFLDEQVAILHSRLSSAERSDQWEKIYEGRAQVVIGARSAIFAPVKNLGLIVVDEEHERTYKQEEDPRYHARDVAVKRGEIEKTLVILGSATPSLESYYEVKKGNYALVKLNKRIDDRPLANVKIVNLKEEIKKFRKLVVFSYPLLAKIRDRLEKKRADNIIS